MTPRANAVNENYVTMASDLLKSVDPASDVIQFGQVT